MPNLYAALAELMAQLAAEVKKRREDGSFTFEDIWAVLMMAVQAAVRLAETYAGYDGPAKKAAVTQALGSFYDQVITPLTIPGIPRFLQGMADSVMKNLLLKWAGLLIDFVVDLLNRTGWDTLPVQPSTPGMTLPILAEKNIAIGAIPALAEADAAGCNGGGCNGGGCGGSGSTAP